MKHCFIINPAAGHGQGVKNFLSDCKSTMETHNIHHGIHISRGRKDIIDYIRDEAGHEERVRFYAVGGDGTVNDVLNGMALLPNTELAVVPMGTGNDFVRNFTHSEYFADPERWLSSTTVKLDVLQYGDKFAMNMMNIGIDCDIAAEASAMKNRILRGSLTYILGVMKILPQRRSYRMRYTVNGEVFEEELLLAAFGNGRYCGGGFCSCPQSDLRDSLMDICLVRPVHGWKLLKLFLEYKKGTYLTDPLAEEYVTYIQSSSFTLEPCSSVRISIDGEIGAFEGGEFRVLPNQVTVAVPDGSALIAGLG